MTSVTALLTEGKSIIDKMTSATAYFAGAATLLTTAQTALDVLTAAVAVAQKGSVANTTSMNLAAADFKTKLMILVLFAEVIALSNPIERDDIIASAGLMQKKTGIKNIQEISAKLGKTPGSVIIRRKRVRGSSYLLQQSNDITNPANWATVTVSTTSKIPVAGLKPKKEYWFRVALIKGTAQSAFTKIVSIVVL